MDEGRRKALNRITLAGVITMVVGVVIGLIPVTYNGFSGSISCGSGFAPIQFGSDLVQTTMTESCDTSTGAMLATSLIVAGIGLVVVVIALFMRVPSAQGEGSA